MPRLSGPEWCSEFPTSTSVDDLADPFRRCVVRFLNALRDAGAETQVSATYRPPERAYLMHYAAMIGHGQDPAAIPAMARVDIDWSHAGDIEAARSAAAAMAKGYGIVYPAALVSRHTQRLAIDMDVSWKNVIHVIDGQGIVVPIDNYTGRTVLHGIGKSYGVIKLLSDPPHWSSDGH